MRCVEHIINLIIWDGLKENNVSINCVYGVVKYVIQTPNRLCNALHFKRFKLLVINENIICEYKFGLGIIKI